MKIEDRLINDQDFYVRTQKVKIIITIVGLVVCYFTGAMDQLISVFI